ncbi:MAG: dTMP kinase [bacterium]
MSSGAFLTVEGSDGAGKTTQLEYIESWLLSRKIEVVRTREPGGTELGEKLRNILLNQVDLSISNETELLMIFAARQQHLQELILPALAQGKWVLCDRFTDATYAYQGAGRGIDENKISILEQWVQQGVEPDLTLILDVDVAIGRQRSESRGDSPDRFERQAAEFKQAVRACYLDRSEKHAQRVRVVDAAGSIEAVQQAITRELKDFIRRRGPD